MNYTLALAAALAAGIASPVLANEAPQANAQGAPGLLDAASAEYQARLHLAHQGYVNISPLARDEDGRWIGTAMKDGKTMIVAVAFPRPNGDTASN